jgi:hypothetical protein
MLENLFSILSKDIATAMGDSRDRELLRTILGGIRPIVSYQELVDGDFRVECHQDVVDWLSENHKDVLWVVNFDHGPIKHITVPKGLMEILLLKFR